MSGVNECAAGVVSIEGHGVQDLSALLRREAAGGNCREKENRSGLFGKSFDVGPAASAGTGDDVRQAVAVHIPGRDADAALESAVVCHEFVHEIIRSAVEKLYVWSAALAGAGDDVGATVAIYVSDSDVDPAGECGTVCHEFLDQVSVGAVELTDMWSAAGAGSADDVVDTVTVHVPHGHADAARELRIESEET